MANRINFEIGFNVDRNGIREIQSSLNSLFNMSENNIMNLNRGMGINEARTGLTQLRSSVTELQNAINSSFNQNLGEINISRFNEELKNLDLNRIHQNLQLAGRDGEKAFRDLSAQILTTNLRLKETNNFTKKMMETLANTVRWSIASTAINTFTSSIQQAYGYIKSLDRSLNDIRIVTGKSSDEMALFAKEANEAAQALGTQTRKYSDASLIYFQQGLADEEAKARAEVTVKAANVTQQSTAEVSEQLTAIWNGYKVSAQEAELYIDKVAAVAATTASNLEELSVGMSKVASAAASMGVNVDQLNAMIATIISVTRQAPESVGTALKTIFARMGDLKVEGQDEFGVTLGEVSEVLDRVGVKILDENDNLREMGTVIEEVGEKWKNWTEAQRQAVAIAMAGKRQYNNLVAFFDNLDMYDKALQTSVNSMGTLQEQQDTFMEGTQGKLQTLGAAVEGVYSSLIDSKDINIIIDGLTSVVKGIDNLADNLGGLVPIALSVGTSLVGVFSDKISKSIVGTIDNIKGLFDNMKKISAQKQIVSMFGNAIELRPYVQELVNIKQQFLNMGSLVTEEQHNIVNALIMQRKELQDVQEAWDTTKQKAENFFNSFENLTGRRLDFSTVFSGLTPEALEERRNAITEELNMIRDQFINAGSAVETYFRLLRRVDAVNVVNSQLDKDRRQRAVTALESTLNQYIASLREANNVQGISEAQTERNTRILDVYTSRLETIINLSRQRTRMERSGEDTTEITNRIIRLRELNRNTGIAISQQYRATGAEIEQIIQEVTTALDRELNRETANIQRQLDENTNNIRSFGQRVLQLINIEVVARIISSIGQIAMAINSIKSLGSIWADEDIETFDKLLRSLISLSMVFPMFIGGLKNIYKALEFMALGLEASAAAAETFSVVTTGFIGILLLAVGGFMAHSAAVEKDTEKLRENREEKLKDIQANQEEKKSIQELYDSYKDIYNTYIETGDKKDELAEKTKELYSKFDEEANAVDLLRENYEKLNEEINKKIDNQLVDSYIELQQSERLLAEEIGDLQSTEFNSDFGFWNFLNDKWYHAETKKGFNFKVDLDPREDAYKYYTSFESTLKKYFEDNKLDIDLSNISEKKFGLGGSYDYLYGINFSNISSARDMKDFYEALEQVYNDYFTQFKDDDNAFDMTFIKEIQTWLGEKKELYNQILQQIENEENNILELTKTKINQSLNPSQIDSIEELEKYKDDFINIYSDFAKEMDMDVGYENIKNSLNSYLSTFENLKDIILKLDLKEKLKEELSLSNEDIEQIFSNFSNKDFEIAFQLDFSNIKSLENFYDEMNKKSIEFNKINSQNISKSIQSVISALTEDGNLDDLEEEMSSLFNSTIKVTEGIHGALTVEQEWKYVSEQGVLSQIEYLQDLLSVYNNYSNEVEKDEQERIILLEKNKEKLEEQKKALEETLEEYKKVTYIAAKDNNQENWKYFNNQVYKTSKKLEEVNNEIQKIDSNLDNLAKKDVIDIDMDGVKNIENIADSIFNQSDKIKSVADLIGEGFKVAADDARELASVYPELLKDAEMLADGQMKLNDSVVQQFKQGQMDVLNGDIESTEKQIDNQIAILEADRAATVAKLEMAYEVASGELKMDADSIDTMMDNKEILTTYLINKGIEEEKAQKAVAYAMAGNMEEYNKIVGQVGDDIATNLANAIYAAAEATKENVAQMALSLKSFVNNAVNDTAQAIADINSGKAFYGRDGSLHLGGRSVRNAIEGGGVKRGRYSPQKTVENFVGIDPEIVESAAPDIRKNIEKYIQDIGEYDAAIARLEAIKMALRVSGGNTKKALDEIGKPKDKKSGSKKGGSGKDSKNDELDYVELLEDESDIYHDINIEIQQLENNLNKLKNQEERMIGKELLKNLELQLNILKKQEESYETKLKLMNEEKKSLRGMLKGYGVEFNNDETIKNYYKKYKEELDKVNKIREKYNNARSKEEQDRLKNEMEIAEKSFENFKTLIESYDTLNSETIPEFKESIKDLQDQEIELKIKKSNIRLDIAIDTGDFFKKLKDFQRDVIESISETDYFKSAIFNINKIQSYFNDNGELELRQKKLEDSIKNYKKASDESKSKYYEEMVKDAEDYMSVLTEIKSILNEIEEAYLNLYNEAKSAFDLQNEIFDSIREQNEHEKDVMVLLFGEEAYNKLDKYYQKQKENNKEQLEMRKKEVDFAKKRLEEANKLKATTKEEKQFREDTIKQAQENLREAESNLNNMLLQTLQTIQDLYENSINLVIKNFKDKFTNGLGLERIENDWKLINQEAEQYLDTINKQYEIQKLQEKYEEALNENDSISAQNKLSNIMEKQLKILKEKDKISQYEIDRANLLFELTLKQIALEDSQNNKTKMRLRRDSQGNYNYQFVADEEEILKAQQELNNKRQELYNKDKDNYKDSLEQTQNIFNSFFNDLKSASEEPADIRDEAIKNIFDKYDKIANNAFEKFDVARNNLMESTLLEYSRLNGVAYDEVLKMTDDQKEIIMEQMVPNWKNGISDMINSILSKGGLSNALDELLNDFQKISAENKENVNKTIENSGRQMDGYSGKINKVNKELTNMLKNNEELFSQYDLKFKNFLEDVYLKYQKIARSLNTIGEKAENAFKQVNKLNKELLNKTLTQTTTEKRKEKKDKIDSLAKKVINKGLNISIKDVLKNDSEYNSLSEEDKKDLIKKVKSLRAKEKEKIFSNLTKKVLKYGPNIDIQQVLKNDENYKSLSKAQKEELIKIIKNKQKKLKSTGKTEAELKNKINDFINVGYMKSEIDESKIKNTNNNNISNLFSSIAKSSLNAINSFISSNMKAIGYSPSVTTSSTLEPLEQNVHIEAIYPNVHDAKQIEIALNNLTNIASQYAYSN